MGDSAMSDRALSPDEVAEWLGVTVSTLPDGQIHVKTDDDAWTLPPDESGAIAAAVLILKIAQDRGY